ncbi:hypothetical protein Moror_2011 [Moniliophthora roreri MCA 2997]|uniref:PLC-like phosphodiesterase n=1 Tax=Moniliophthora roreri (strain MCA 2997) TaxID=1381753 RepID=V2X166_MONRO|nr:hypothetical protein Moror_2011 [Moniliophthora roreri MCA 2997]
MNLLLSFVILAFGTAVFGLPLTSKRATICNGRAELCSRSYGNTTFLGSHNSYAVSTDIFAVGRNQEVSITAQLDLGVRFLQAQAHQWEGNLRFCHTSCILFDGGLVVDYLKKVKSWLDAHPNEVLTLLVTNPDNVSLRDVWKPAFDSSGVTPLTYVPPTNPMKRGDWPTLGSLIDSGKRVIVFMDSGADGAGVDFILPQFKMIWEPPFSSTDPNFPCSVDRNEGPLSVTDHMHMLNHNLNVNIIPIGDGVLVADRANAARTNSVSSIMANAGGCAPLAAGKAPNFVMLDWVNVGEGMKAVNMLNGFA